jgi:hypothetical protein
LLAAVLTGGAIVGASVMPAFNVLTVDEALRRHPLHAALRHDDRAGRRCIFGLFRDGQFSRRHTSSI